MRRDSSMSSPKAGLGFVLKGVDGPRSAGLWQTVLVVVGSLTSAVGQVIPPTFIENDGQWDQSVSLGSRWPGLAAVVRDGSLALSVDRNPADDHGSGPGIVLALGSPLPEIHQDATPQDVMFNFFLGQDPTRWRSRVRAHRILRWCDAADGVVLEVQATRRGPLLRWTIDAGALPVILGVGRAVGETMVSPVDGSIRVVRGDTWLRLLPPVAEAHLPDGQLRRVDCRYAFDTVDQFGVAVNRSDDGLPVTVSSAIEWSTYLGGSDFENIESVLVNPAGDFVIVGVTKSLDFPTTPGSYDETHGDRGQDMFVTALNPQSGLPHWSTFIGGGGGGFPTDVALAANGDVVITGWGNQFFPVTPGAYFTPPPENLFGACFCRVSADGTALVYAGLVGANSTLDARSSALAQDESVIIVGATGATDLPVTPDALDLTKAGLGNDDGFIIKLDATGSRLVYCTYLGDSSAEVLRAVAVDTNGDVIVAGPIGGPPPLPPGAFQTSYVGPYIARFSSDFSEVKAATYFGGGCVDDLRDLAVGPDGSIILVGWTCSMNMPTTPDAFQPSLAPGLGIAGFVTRFNPMLTDLTFSTFVGSGLGLRLESVHVDGSGLITVAGRADSDGFPVTAGAFDPTYNSGTGDMIVGRLRPDGKKWYYGTYVGGTKSDVPEGEPVGLGVDTTGATVVGGLTASADYPVSPGAWHDTLSGPTDVGLTKLTMLPAGVERYGDATAGSLGLPAAGVTAMPGLGSDEFGVTCTQAPPTHPGLLVLGLASLDRPLPAEGVELWVDPTPLLAFLPVQSDEQGFCERPLRVPSNPSAAGLTAYGQFVWKDTAGPSGWSASNALAITIQP
jgi:hypothetical protein